MIDKNPKVFISYSHDSPAHMDRVKKLSDRLRRDGINVTLDQDLVAPPEDWPFWTEQRIRDSDYVLVICTRRYRNLAEEDNDPGSESLGVRWEAGLIRKLLYFNRGVNRKFVPILLEGEPASSIPLALQGYTEYFPETPSGHLSLKRHLTRLAQAEKPLRSTDEAPVIAVPQRPSYFVHRSKEIEDLKNLFCFS